MKKIIISAAVAAMALSTSAVAADKGIDIDVSGQAVVFYETHDDKGPNGLFDESNSVGAGGIQLNLGADLGNNFTFGSQLTYLSTLGLEKNLVDNGAQLASAGAGVNDNTVSELALTKIFIAKKIGNTTLKIGRQELPASLAPLSFSEGDSVFKNTFDAIVAINTDIPDTTVVAGYVSKGTGKANLGTSGDLPSVAGGIYMLTAQTTVIPMTTLTATYYEAKNVLGTIPTVVTPTGGVSASAYWVDAAIAPKDAPAGLTVGLQAGVISPDGTTTEDTKAYGVKIGAKVEGITLTAAYTSVDGDAKTQVAIRNLGTNGRTPLYTQQVMNEDAIALDSDTILIGAGYDAGDMGNFAVSYSMSEVGQYNGLVNTTTTDKDHTELDFVYKVKSGGIQYAAIVALRDVDNGGTISRNTINGTAGATEDTIVRVWARYNF